MNLLLQFGLYNFLPSILAGLIAWGAIYAAISMFRIQYAPLRLSLLYTPLLKSLLVLLGVSLVLPWPRELFAGWQAQAVSWRFVLPLVVLWAGGLILGRSLLTRRARRRLVDSARPAGASAPRLARSLDRVMERYQASGLAVTGEIIHCVRSQLQRPELLVGVANLNSPLILTDEGPPVIVFPAALISRLDDEELDGAVAHELAHAMVRSPHWCSPQHMRRLGFVSPISRLLDRQLRREEEKACDDMAVAALGDPDRYAGMLLKSYRFAAAQSGQLTARFRAVPQLLGLKSMLSERVERLLADDPPVTSLRTQGLLTCLLWAGVIALFF